MNNQENSQNSVAVVALTVIGSIVITALALRPQGAIEVKLGPGGVETSIDRPLSR